MDYPRTGKVIRVGDSLAIVIPKPILRSLKIERGDRVVFGVYDENIIAVRRIPPEELQRINPADLTF